MVAVKGRNQALFINKSFCKLFHFGIVLHFSFLNDLSCDHCPSIAEHNKDNNPQDDYWNICRWVHFTTSGNSANWYCRLSAKMLLFISSKNLLSYFNIPKEKRKGRSVQFLLNFLDRCDNIFLRRNSIWKSHRECVFTLVKMHSPFCVPCGFRRIASRQ